MRRKPMTFAERVTTPEFKADVARHAVKLEAEQAGWIVLNPQTHRALLAGAAAIRRHVAWLNEVIPPEDAVATDKALMRVADRLDRLSRPQRAGRGR